MKRERYGTSTYYQRSYDSSIKFTKGSKTVTESYKVRKGNVVPRKKQ